MNQVENSQGKVNFSLTINMSTCSLGVSDNDLHTMFQRKMQNKQTNQPIQQITVDSNGNLSSQGFSSSASLDHILSLNFWSVSNMFLSTTLDSFPFFSFLLILSSIAVTKVSGGLCISVYEFKVTSKQLIT